MHTAKIAGNWTVRGSNTGGGRDFSHPPRPALGAHPASYTMGIGSLFPGVKRPGHGVNHPAHLAPRLKKEYSYTSSPPPSLRGLFYDEVYLYLYTATITERLLIPYICILGP